MMDNIQNCDSYIKSLLIKIVDAHYGCDGVMWTGLVWLRIRTGGEFL
jgi:hypothetical protein